MSLQINTVYYDFTGCEIMKKLERLQPSHCPFKELIPGRDGKIRAAWVRVANNDAQP